jgi:hypothetical protein
MTVWPRLRLPRHALPALCILVAAFTFYDQDWEAVLGWAVAAAGWASSEHWEDRR